MAALSGNTGECLFGAAFTIVGAAADTPGDGEVRVQTQAAHGRVAKDRVKISGVVGMTDLNANHTITNVSDTTHFDVTLDTAQTWSSGGTGYNVVEITGWSLTETGEVSDVTDSASTTWKDFIPTSFLAWEGSFEGFLKSGTNFIGMGSSIALILQANGATQMFNGNAIVTSTGTQLSVPGTDAVKVSFNFRGTSTLTTTSS